MAAANISYEQLMRNLVNRVYSPIYFLHGEEAFYIDEVIRYIENNVLEEADRAFNQTVVYGRDVTARDIADRCRVYSMLGNYQVIIVKEAQDLTANNRKLDDLESYIENPQENTILVMGYKYKKLDKRKSFYKKLKKSDKVTFLETKKVYDNQIPGWIDRYVKEKGYSIDAVSTRLLADYVGSDLSRLVNEINKLFITADSSKRITPQTIETNIGISKDYNIFELTKALGTKNVFKAQQIIHYFEANPKDNPLQMITVMLYNYFVKVFLYHRFKKGNPREIASSIGVNPAFINDYAMAAGNYPPGVIRKIISEIRDLDLKSKGYGAVDAKDYGPLSEFVYKCMHGVFL